MQKEIEDLEYKKRWLESEVAQLSGDLERIQEALRVCQSLALVLRTQYKNEIAAGEHAGFKLDEVVVRYMMRERKWRRAGLWGRMIMALRGEI